MRSCNVARDEEHDASGMAMSGINFTWSVNHMLSTCHVSHA